MLIGIVSRSSTFASNSRKRCKISMDKQSGLRVGHMSGLETSVRVPGKSSPWFFCSAYMRYIWLQIEVSWRSDHIHSPNRYLSSRCGPEFVPTSSIIGGVTDGDLGVFHACFCTCVAL